MANTDMLAYLEGVASSKNYKDLHNLLYRELKAHGIDRFHYILIPPNSLFDKNEILFFQRGYEHIPGLIKEFEAYFQSKEAIDYFSFHQNVSTRAHYSLRNNPNKGLDNLFALLAKYRHHLMMTDALTVPVFGAKSYYGYFHMPADKQQDSPQRRRMLEFLCQNVHQRIVEINLLPPKHIKLSQREKDVLLELVRGKKNSEIAHILDISRHTVDEYIRRIFIKLEVNDRVTASLKATKLHLLENEAPSKSSKMSTAPKVA